MDPSDVLPAEDRCRVAGGHRHQIAVGEAGLQLVAREPRHLQLAEQVLAARDGAQSDPRPIRTPLSRADFTRDVAP